MSNGDTSIEQKLRTAWSQEQRYFHIRGLARLLIWVVVLVLVDLLIDWGIFFRSRLTGTPQLLLLIINVGVLGWVIWNEWLRHLKRYDAVRVSLEVEAKHTELRSILVSYMQLKDHDAESLNASQSLLDAMRNQAISLTRPLDFREVVDFRQLRNLFMFAVVCIATFSSITYLRTEEMRSLFLRLVGVDKDYPTNTKVDLVTKNITIKKGESVEIVAIANGRIQVDGRLFVRSKSESWDSKPMIKDEEGPDKAEFKSILSEIDDELTYYLRIGDALTEKYKISVSPNPVILSTRISFEYPAYMERDGSSEPPVETLNLSVPEGTTVKWVLKCHPAIRALDVIHGDEKTAATISEDGLTAQFEITADETFKYTFLWTEKKHGFEYDDIQHLVRVVPDRIPDIELVSPSADGVGTVNKELIILARASDDHQLGSAHLMYTINDSEEKSLELEPLSGTLKEIRYPWKLAENLPDLKPGDRLAYYLKVSDNVPPKGSHINISATRRLAILTQEQYLAWFKNELDAQREIIGKARDLEKRATVEVTKLKNEETREEPNEDKDKKEEPEK